MEPGKPAHQGALVGHAAMFLGTWGCVECVVRQSGGATKERCSGATKVATHRFRQEIADTMADPAEVETEPGILAAVLSGN